MLDTEKNISMDGQEIPILWKYIFNLETRLDKLEQIMVADINPEINQDKVESDCQELTEAELARVLDNLMPDPKFKKKSLLDKAWENSQQIKDVTPTIKTPKRESSLEKIQENARRLLDEDTKQQQKFVDRLQSARLELDKNIQDTVAADIKQDINYHKGYIIPVYDKRKRIVVPPEKIPSDEYFLSKEYQRLKQAKLNLQPSCEFSGQTAQHVMHKHYNNLGSETPDDFWSLCSWHYKEVIGKQPQGESPFPINWVIISPNNYIFQVEILSTFSDANGLHKSSMSDVAGGRRRHHKGWKCYHHKDYQMVLDYLNKNNKKISDGTMSDKSYPSIREINESEGGKNAGKKHR